jgi:hypothetical protein
VTISTPVYSAADTMTLTATATAGETSLTAVTSGNIVFSAGAAAKLAFTTQPGGGTSGTAWTTQPVVTVEDANGNTVTGSSASITLAIGTNPTGGTLTCTTNPQSASSGVDTFAGCRISNAGTGFTLTATSSGLTSATSSTFIVTGIAITSADSLTANHNAGDKTLTVTTSGFTHTPAITISAWSPTLISGITVTFVDNGNGTATLTVKGYVGSKPGTFNATITATSSDGTVTQFFTLTTT